MSDTIARVRILDATDEQREKAKAFYERNYELCIDGMEQKLKELLESKNPRLWQAYQMYDYYEKVDLLNDFAVATVERWLNR